MKKKTTYLQDLTPEWMRQERVMLVSVNGFPWVYRQRWTSSIWTGRTRWVTIRKVSLPTAEFEVHEHLYTRLAVMRVTSDER